MHNRFYLVDTPIRIDKPTISCERNTTMLMLVTLYPVSKKAENHVRTLANEHKSFILSYVINPIFGGDTYHLYREPKMTCVISDLGNPTNIPSYSSNKVEIFLLCYELAHTNWCEFFM